MIQLKLTDAEAEVLRNILTYHLSELRMEIAGTDSKDFRDDLKEREEVITRLLAELEAKTES